MTLRFAYLLLGLAIGLCALMVLIGCELAGDFREKGQPVRVDYARVK